MTKTEQNDKDEFMKKMISFRNNGVFKNIIFTIKEKDEIESLLFTNARLLKLKNKYDKVIESAENSFYNKFELEKLKFDIEIREEILGIHKQPGTIIAMEQVKVIWNDIKVACYNKAHTSYQFYGLHGIRMYKAWLDFDNFLQDMGECPKGLSIQRIDENEDFTPDNCCWCTNQGIVSARGQENILNRARKIVEIRLRNK